jgi:hypothetical protein
MEAVWVELRIRSPWSLICIPRPEVEKTVKRGVRAMLHRGVPSALPSCQCVESPEKVLRAPPRDRFLEAPIPPDIIKAPESGPVESRVDKIVAALPTSRLFAMLAPPATTRAPVFGVVVSEVEETESPSDKPEREVVTNRFFVVIPPATNKEA